MARQCSMYAQSLNALAAPPKHVGNSQLRSFWVKSLKTGLFEEVETVMLSPYQSLVSTRMASKACAVLIETKICLS